MGMFSGPPKPKPPKPIIAPPVPFQPKPAQAAQTKNATNASLDARITAPSGGRKNGALAQRTGGTQTRKRTLLGGTAN